MDLNHFCLLGDNVSAQPPSVAVTQGMCRSATVGAAQHRFFVVRSRWVAGVLCFRQPLFFLRFKANPTVVRVLFRRNINKRKYACICIFMNLYAHIFIDICMYICVCINIFVYINVCICVWIYI